MKMREILHVKGFEVHTIGPQATLHDVVQKLVDKNCGSLVVMDAGRMVGIITERDILRATAAGLAMPDARVEERMSVNLVTGGLDDDVESIMGLMTRHRIRHLPVTDRDELAGLISIGDVVKAQHDSLSVENHYLKSYIQS